MKQSLLSILFLLVPMLVNADAVEIDGIYFNLITKAKTAEVTSNPNKYSGEVVIPESVEYEGATYTVTAIGKEAFNLCDELTSVTIPGSVTTIGITAFANSNKISSLKIPYGVETIGDYAFYGCNGLVSVDIANSVKSIGQWAFTKCRSLTSITIPGSISTISTCTFEYCDNLTSVILKEGVTIIGSGAFQFCKSLSSLVIPNSVNSIYGYAFRDCISLSSISMPSDISLISQEAFSGCSGLTDVYCYAEKVPNTSADAFKDSYIDYVMLHVPAVSINDYMTTEPWKNFKEIVAIGDEQIDQCAKPTIAYENGKIIFSCETEGVEFVSEIKAADAKKYYDGKITLTNTYTVSVYATKNGYANSDLATMEIHPTNSGEGGSGLGETGDVNGDKKVDVSDIVKIVNIIMNGSGTSSDNPSIKPSDESVTSMISASFGGGAYSSINGVIQSGSQLMWRFSNNSSESVILTGIQMIDGVTGAEGSNMLTENVEVLAGETKGYTITVGVLGIQQPKVRFTYQYNNKTYTVEAVMPD